MRVTPEMAKGRQNCPITFCGNIFAPNDASGSNITGGDQSVSCTSNGGTTTQDSTTPPPILLGGGATVEPEAISSTINYLGYGAAAIVVMVILMMFIYASTR